MKRSTINNRLEWAKGVLKQNNFKLPMFGYWRMDEWRSRKNEIDRIKKTMLGRDVTDFGSGEFDKIGSVLFTIRNGNIHDEGCGTPYAEKVILMKERQVLPLHFHFSKTEDIINRGGGILILQLYNTKGDKKIDEEKDVTVYCDGIRTTVKAGESIEIHPGNSITLTPYIYHRFIANEGTGNLVVGEVSKINDDNKDNHFARESAHRFNLIEEDEDILYPLCNEYDSVL